MAAPADGRVPVASALGQFAKRALCDEVLNGLELRRKEGVRAGRPQLA